MKKTIVMIAAVMLMTAFISGCITGGDETTTTTVKSAGTTQVKTTTTTIKKTGTTTNQQQTGQTVRVTQANNSFGVYLLDSNGIALYISKRDTVNKSNCWGNCTERWIPFVVNNSARIVGPANTNNKFATLGRGNNIRQVTFNGMPLYYFADDKVRGEHKGQANAENWYVVNPITGPILTNPWAKTTTTVSAPTTLKQTPTTTVAKPVTTTVAKAVTTTTVKAVTTTTVKLAAPTTTIKKT